MRYLAAPETAVIAVLLGVTGAVSMALIHLEAIPGAFRPDELPFLLIYAAAGATVAGAIVAPMFGRRGLWGWALAALGGFLATALGAYLGGAAYFTVNSVFPVAGGEPLTLIQIPLMSLFASSVVIASLGIPVVLAVWGALMAATHAVAVVLR